MQPDRAWSLPLEGQDEHQSRALGAQVVHGNITSWSVRLTGAGAAKLHYLGLAHLLLSTDVGLIHHAAVHVAARSYPSSSIS